MGSIKIYLEDWIHKCILHECTSSNAKAYVIDVLRQDKDGWMIHIGDKSYFIEALLLNGAIKKMKYIMPGTLAKSIISLKKFSIAINKKNSGYIVVIEEVHPFTPQPVNHEPNRNVNLEHDIQTMLFERIVERNMESEDASDIEEIVDDWIKEDSNVSRDILNVEGSSEDYNSFESMEKLNSSNLEEIDEFSEDKDLVELCSSRNAYPDSIETKKYTQVTLNPSSLSNKRLKQDDIIGAELYIPSKESTQISIPKIDIKAPNLLAEEVIQPIQPNLRKEKLHTLDINHKEPWTGRKVVKRPNTCLGYSTEGVKRPHPNLWGWIDISKRKK